MPDALVSDFVEERAAKITLIENLSIAARDAGRDLNEDDLDTITKAKERIARIDVQLEALADNLELSDSVRDRLNRLQPGSAPLGVPEYRSAGELLWDAIHAATDRDAAGRWGRFQKRVAQHMGTTAAATTPTAGGVPGLLIDPTVGPIIDPVPGGRPLLTALGVQAAPRAMTFHRPYIVDPDLATGVAPQALQKAELVSKKFDVNRQDLALTVIGGYLNVSQPLIEFAPQGLDIIIRQLNKRYAVATEAAALAEMANSTSQVELDAAADGAALLAAIFEASAMVYSETGELAQWVAMGPQGWARLGSLVDAAGRPLFPTLNPANAFGTANASSFAGSVAGLGIVVTPAIDDGSMWVGNSSALEFYEHRFPLLEAVEPSLLGRQVAVSGAIAAYRPYPGNGAVLLSDTVP
jgi:hypothetical protein